MFLRPIVSLLLPITVCTAAFGKDYQIVDPTAYQNYVNIYNFDFDIPPCSCLLDQYIFSVPTNTNINASFSYSLGYAMFPEVGTITLTNQTQDPPIILGSDSFNALKNSATVSVASSPGATYTLIVNLHQVPTIDSEFNYSINIAATTAPVVEMPTGALMLAGLSAMFGLVRRSRSQMLSAE